MSMNGKFVIIHNGIIENYTFHKRRLCEKGYTFKSETDTEVLANLIEDLYIERGCSAEEAVRAALNMVIGAYGLVVMCVDEPDKVIGSRVGSPLVLGVGDGEYFLASDATPIVEYTDRMIYMNDGEMVIITKEGYRVTNLNDETLKEIEENEWRYKRIKIVPNE
jgi:glucosamine--fructose-6-phosphate aminotransferase (isomerizing)